MGLISNPTTFNQWRENEKSLMAFVLENKKFPDKVDFSKYYENEDAPDASNIFIQFVVGVVGCIPGTGALISALGYSVFDFFMKQGQNFNKWKTFIEKTEQLIDNKIIKYNDSLIISIVGRVSNNAEKYYSARNAFEKVESQLKNDPKNTELKDKLKKKQETIRMQFDDLSDILDDTLLVTGQLRQEVYAIAALNTFTLLATIHIALLNDLKISGERWDMDDDLLKNLIDKIPNVKNDYMKHAIKTYEMGIEKIKNLPEIDDVEKFNRYLDFKSTATRYVFDVIDSWFLYDFDKYKYGGFKENVRYIFTSSIGRPVNNNPGVEVDYFKDRVDYPINPYYSPSFEDLMKRFDETNIEQYKGDLIGVNSYTKTYNSYNYLCAIEPYFNGVVEENTRYGCQKDGTKKQVLIKPKSDSSVSQVCDDLVPNILNVDNVDIYSTNMGSPISLRRVGNREIFYISPAKFKSGVPGHKFSNVYVNSINKQAVKISGESGEGVVDCLYIGYSREGQFLENNLISGITNVINCQKFSSKVGKSITFVKDHLAPSVHSMKIDNGCGLKYKINVSKNEAFDISLRYFYKGTNPGQVTIKIGTLEFKHQLSNCKTEEIEIKTDDPKKPRIVKFNHYATSYGEVSKEDGVAKGNEITVISNCDNFYLNSIIFNPSTKTQT